MKTRDQRFWEKVLKTETCWIWISTKNYSGYGVFKLNGKWIRSHRYSYIQFNGEIPEGLNALHNCDVRACVNPAHLRLGTQKENVADSVDRKRHVYPPRLHGENNPVAKLTLKNVMEARELYDLGWNFTALGKRYKVSRTGIRKAILGKTWTTSFRDAR